MELDRCDPPRGVDEALDRAVVQVAVADAVAAAASAGSSSTRDLVVVGPDVDAPGGELEHRVVAAVVSDRQAPVRAPGGKARS